MLWVICRRVSLCIQSHLNSSLPKQSNINKSKKCVHSECISHSSAIELCSARSIKLLNLLSHFNLLPFMCCVGFSEKCYETIHLRYYDTGESWGRIHLRNVEQCTCMAGEIKCERVRYTSKMCFQRLICFTCVMLLLCGLLLLGWSEWNTTRGCIYSNLNTIHVRKLLNWLSVKWTFFNLHVVTKNQLN